MKYLKVFSITLIALLSYAQTTFAQTKPTATPTAVQTSSKAKPPKAAVDGKKTAQKKHSKADHTSKANKQGAGEATTTTRHKKGSKKHTNAASKSSDTNAPTQHALIGSLPNNKQQQKAENTPKTKGVNTVPPKTNTKELNKPSGNTAQNIPGKDQKIGHDAKGRQMYRGSRGGEYYLNASGTKEYTKPEKQ